jgi:hypothetical protein
VLLPAFSSIRCGGRICAQVLVYSCRPDRREQGHGVYHALAHGILTRSKIVHAHSDAFALTLALMATKTVVTRMLRKRHSEEVARLLGRCNIHAPIPLLKARVQWIHRAAQPLKLQDNLGM